MKEAKVIRKLFPLLKLYPWAIPVIVVLGILASLSEGLGISLFIPLLQSFDAGTAQTAQSNVLIAFFDRIFAQIPIQNRLPITAGFIFGSVLLKNALLYGNTLLFSWLNWRISYQLRSGIFRQLLSVGYSFLERYPSGKFLSTLDNETWRTSQALSVLVGLIISSCTVVVFTILLLLISWRLTLLVAAVMLLISSMIQFMTRQVKQLGKQAEKANAVFVQRVWEGLLGMRVIREFGRESYEQARFDQASRQVCHSFMELDRISGAVYPLSEVLSTGLLAGILVIALQQQVNLPTLLTFVFMLYRLQPQVRHVDGARVNLMSLTTAIDDVMSLLDRSDKPYIRSGKTRFTGLRQAIAFRAVDFCYGPGEKTALQNISICIPKGKTTAIVGPSGAGKSTLISLICRFYDPTSGEIEIDGQPLPQLNLADWRDRIAVVSQSVHIFSTTVYENIAYGRPEATEAEVIAAAKQANAHEFISQLPQGYQTQVGDQGVRLSGGQRQRLALARAIIRNPEILILDEATNALDSISEHLIQEAINALSQRCTLIVIAHRLSTIEQADQIIVIEEGQVTEQGTMAELLKRDRLFAQLYRLQYRNAQL
ncbi:MULTISPECIES: ABC transporter ATP-binding protein [Trichocoleus]|uniref:ABC transporter ATP-binding protein/permease n=1 Tax=Trichocoleus desertorum GB2-A4 TaxID=2933944 RepID=A0ABV0J5I2_9CYAN|nr:ABC transporter ATP-binding protein [Trichocoleus sp. FACHB-46]MBD1863875.1 ABC transporter ATP-binding protein [Trichocoleus sp. FACHB-46]